MTSESDSMAVAPPSPGLASGKTPAIVVVALILSILGLSGITAVIGLILGFFGRGQAKKADVTEEHAKQKFPDGHGGAYLQVAQGRLENQMSVVDGLDTKAAGLLAASLAEIAFVTALLTIRMAADITPSRATWILFAVSGILTLFVLLVSLTALQIRSWQRYPDPDEAWKVAFFPHLPWELAMTLDHAFRQNAQAETRKGTVVRWIQRTLLVQTAVTAAAAIVLLTT